MLDAFLRQLVEKHAGHGIQRLAAELAQPGVAQVKLFLGARDAHKRQTAFFLDVLLLGHAALVRQQPLLDCHHVDDREL